MAGKDGLPERLWGRLDRLVDVLDAEIERLVQAPAEHAAQGERVGKAVRSLGLGVRSIAEAAGAVDKLRADPADEDEDADDGGADDERPRLSPEALDELRADVERRYARFDQEPVGAVAADPGPVRAGPAGDAGGVGGAGARPAAGAPGRLVDVAVPGWPRRGQDAGRRGVAHGPSG